MRVCMLQLIKGPICLCPDRTCLRMQHPVHMLRKHQQRGRARVQATHVERDDLKPALCGLSMVKGKMLLKKSPTTKEINDADEFSFNDKFKSPHLKIKFATAGDKKEVRLFFLEHVPACCLPLPLCNEGRQERGAAPGAMCTVCEHLEQRGAQLLHESKQPACPL